ncbi:MAG: lipopolysaccharide biosynthesis protein [Halobacteria archaeon]|nr:lipopolysaccharide biosynthesis protein [Halobacteria archaeon]
MTLARQTITGVMWNFTEQVGRRGINVLVTLLLAHFLVPEDFGLVAVTSAIILVASGLMESGFKQALIRMEHAGQVDYNTAFFSNIGLGVVAYAGVFMLAPAVAAFYEEPRITVLIQVGGILILINAFQVVQYAILSKGMDFRSLLLASVPASIVAGVLAVFFAYIGMGVWALLAHMMLYALLNNVFLWRRSDWRPTLAVSQESFREMFGFGSRLFVASTIDVVFRNLYVVVIAKVFYATIAGYYFFASKIKDLIVSQLVHSIMTVIYPALSTVQNDNEKLKDGFRKVLRLSTFILFPALAFLAALAEPLFAVLLPDKWMPAVPYLQILCIAGLLVPVHSTNLNILQIKGRSDLFLRLEIIKKAMLVLILSISLQFGIFGVLVGHIVASVVGYVPNSFYSGKLVNYPAKEQLGDFMPALFIAGAVGVATYFMVAMLDWPAYVELCVLGVLAVVLYVSLAYAFKMKALALAADLLAGVVKKEGYQATRQV